MRIIKIFLFSCFVAICSFQSNAQDYTQYYSLINKAEEQFVTKKDNSCFTYYDQAFAKNKPFLKDPYIAAQIAYYLGDTTRFYNYLSICIENHMPLAAINASPYLRKQITPQTRKKIDSLYALDYAEKQVDSLFYAKICTWCYQSDSIKLQMGRDEQKMQAFYIVENEARQFISDSILPQGKYLNEHFFPITSDQLAEEFYAASHRENLYPGAINHQEYELRVACPFNILLHSYCFFESNKNLLFEAVKKGYLHPKEYGILEETSILWYRLDNNPGEKCDRPQAHICYNILGLNPTKSVVIYSKTEEGLATVEQNRKAIFMQSYAVDEMKKQMEDELGFAFFFDFVDRQ